MTTRQQMAAFQPQHGTTWKFQVGTLFRSALPCPALPCPARPSLHCRHERELRLLDPIYFAFLRDLFSTAACLLQP